MRQRKERLCSRSGVVPRRIAGAYFLIGILWIIFSDRLVSLLVADGRTAMLFQTYKGWFYVAVTAVLLWWCLKEHLTRIYQVERELRASNEALTSILAAAPVAICVTDAEGRIRLWSQGGYRVFGWSEDEIIGTRLTDYHHPINTELLALLQQVREGKTFSDIEMKLRTKDGQEIDISLSLAPLYDESHQVDGAVIVAADITERKAQERKIRKLELIDPLTGIFNRQALERQLRRVVDHLEKKAEAVLMILAIDNFKLVNERVGHELGDVVLAELTNLLTQELPAEAVFGRWSGDEIAVILENTALPQAEKMAEDIRQKVEQRRFAGGVHVTVSIGIVALNADVELHQLISLADEALLHAKSQGKNRVVVHGHKEQHRRILVMANRLSDWIHDDSLKERIMLYFQPIVNLSTGETEFYEALLRVRGQEGEVIAPKDFIPVAERFGLMPEVDYLVLEKAVGILSENPELKLFVNLSGSSMIDLNLLTRIESLLQRKKLKSGQLTIEVTESVAVTDLAQMNQWMQRLRELGCRFALDDFGVGFSTFSNLRAIPVDWVKIDGSFVRNIDGDIVSRKLVASINSVAHSLDKKVVAEWVGSASAVRYLADLGVEYGQGYYLGQPSPEIIPAAGFANWLALSDIACSAEQLEERVE